MLNTREAAALMKELAGVVTKHIGEALRPLAERIKALEGRPAPERGEKGDPGERGADAPSVDEPALSQRITEALKASLPALVAQEIAAHFKANPPAAGKDGAAGEKGEPGQKGEPGMDATVDYDAVVKRALDALPPVVESAVAQHLMKHPPAPGKDGERGPQGEKGADGIGQAGSMIDRDGNLITTMTNGEARNLGVVVGKDGRDGKDGADGISLDSFDMEYLPDTHEMAIKASAGGRTKEVRFAAGGLRAKGFWRDGMTARAGEVYTHAGAAWVAKTDTPTKPATGADAWEIFVRAGRDGERGPSGKDGAPPAPVKLGGNS